MENSATKSKTIQYFLISISFVALFAKNFIDRQYIEHQNEILRIIGFGVLSIAYFMRAKYKEADSKSKNISLILAGILGSIAIGNALSLFYPMLKNLF
jgi:hypothetical protein